MHINARKIAQDRRHPRQQMLTRAIHYSFTQPFIPKFVTIKDLTHLKTRCKIFERSASLKQSPRRHFDQFDSQIIFCFPFFNRPTGLMIRDDGRAAEPLKSILYPENK